MFIVIRAKDGLVCSIPAEWRIAEGIAIYLMSVDIDQYRIIPAGG